MPMVVKPRNIVIYYDHVFELLGRAKTLMPNVYRSRKTETSLEIIYGEIKAL